MPDDPRINELIGEIDERLGRYVTDFEGLTWREKVLLLVEVLKAVKELGPRANNRTAHVRSRERIRLYLVEHVRTVICAAEIEVVSGISEYGRRVRELRVEDGYKILTGLSNDPEAGVTLSGREYYLIDSEPDVTAAHRWHIGNRIRREEGGGSRGRILAYLKESVGQIVTSEELAYVAKASQFGRRTRELRTEEGYAIATRFTGRADLKMGEYILESLDRIAEPHDRRIPFDVQKQVYERANNCCELCGWNHARWSRRDPRIAELHHVTEHADGGANTVENLVVLCSRCHDDVHAGRREIPEEFQRR